MTTYTVNNGIGVHLPKPATLRRRDVTTIAMVNGNEHKHPLVVIAGHRFRWIGFGWVDEGEATVADIVTLPEVKEDNDHDI